MSSQGFLFTKYDIYTIFVFFYILITSSSNIKLIIESFTMQDIKLVEIILSFMLSLVQKLDL
jgi:hypothetical protein